MNPADVKHVSEQTYPNRVRVQPLLPLPNATIPGKNRKKRRVVKIAIGDEIPLELNHSIDGKTTPSPAKPSGGIESTHGNNNTEARIMVEQQHDNMRHEVNGKLDYPTVNINNNSNNSTPSPLSPLLVDTTPVDNVVNPIASSSSANSPHALKMHKGVSFPQEQSNKANNSLPSTDQSTEKDQTKAGTRQEGFLEREVGEQCHLSVSDMNQDTPSFISLIVFMHCFCCMDSILLLISRRWIRRWERFNADEESTVNQQRPKRFHLFPRM